MQVAPGDTEIDGGEPEIVLDEALVDGIPERDLAQLDVTAVLHELAGDRAEPAAEVLPPVGARQLDGRTSTWAEDGARAIRTAKDDVSVPDLGVAVRSEVVERALGAIPDIAALLDVVSITPQYCGTCIIARGFDGENDDIFSVFQNKKFVNS